jgi:septum formation protein
VNRQQIIDKNNLSDMLERKIILASKSPRRKSLLEQIGIKFEIHESEYEEENEKFKNPRELVEYLALQKAQDVAIRFEDAIIIGADTVVVADNEIIGKPKNDAEARSLFKRFGEIEHSVISGFAIIDILNKKTIKGYDEAQVKFRNLTETEISGYIDSGEPFDKAGGYGIQGKATIFIDSISGDYNSIVGLPLKKVYLALREMGVEFF